MPHAEEGERGFDMESLFNAGAVSAVCGENASWSAFACWATGCPPCTRCTTCPLASADDPHFSLQVKRQYPQMAELVGLPCPASSMLAGSERVTRPCRSPCLDPIAPTQRMHDYVLHHLACRNTSCAL